MIQLTIYVADIATVMSLFTHIRIYTSSSESGTYTHLAFVPLAAGQSTYTYIHLTGNSDTWYKSSYYNSSTLVESGLSNAARGSAPSIYHTPTYPSEYDFSASEEIIIRKIRRLIGDIIQLGRIYSTGSDFCTSIESDNHTIDMGEKSWPVYVSINGTQYTSLEDPIVQGYRYLTFSGTLVSGSTYPAVDVWYYKFQFSDREIYEAYGDAMIPPLVPSTCVSTDHLMLQAAIDLLENLAATDMTGAGASIRDDQTSYDPSPGLRERNNLINRLRKQLDALVKECIRSGLLGIEGVLID